MRAPGGPRGLSVLAWVLTLACAGEAPGGVQVTRAVITEPLLGEQSALYLTVHDQGTGDVLLGIEVPGAGRATLHHSLAGATGMTMHAVDSLVLAPRGELALEPGGLHGMLEALDASWTRGDSVTVTLRFRSAGAVEVRAAVVPYAEVEAHLHPEG